MTIRRLVSSTVPLVAFIILFSLVGCATGTETDFDDDDDTTTTTTTTTTTGSGGSATGGQGGSGGEGTSAGGTTTTTTTATTTTTSSTTTSTTTTSTTTTQTSTGGETCADAADVTGASFPYGLSGAFNDDPSSAGSCDFGYGAYNAVWFSYTAPATGSYLIELLNNTWDYSYSVMAVFAGTGCSPLGAELTCLTAEDTAIATTVDLEENESYLILFHTDDDGYWMEDPEITITELVVGPGATCSLAVDVTGASFPHQVTGQFDLDPSPASSCDSSATNAVWFLYTPPSDGLYQIDLDNDTATFAYSVAAVFEGASCAPLGSELVCAAYSSTSMSVSAYLTGGESHLILFHTDGDSYTMEDPTITITPVAVDPGEVCQEAYDVSAESFPFVLSGTFDDDPPLAGSCVSDPTNVVWFRYTAPVTTSYRIELANATTTSAYSRAALFDGTDCSPLGSELACQTASADSITVNVSLTAAQSYLIAFSTDGNSYTMVDPAITITPLATGPGTMCNLAADVSAASFPYEIVGELGGDPSAGGSCDPSPTNAAWFLYTPPSDGLYQFDLVNATSMAAGSVLALFETSSCSPLGTELSCATDSDTTISTQRSLSAGVSYLVLFHTNGDGYPMLDPTITVTDVTPAPGDTCETAYDVSAESFPFTMTGTFDRDPPAAGACDTTPTNAVWFRYTPTASATHAITAFNAATTVSASRLAVFDGTACAPLGTELSCTLAAGASAGISLALVASEPVLIAFYTDGEGFPMVDPQIHITP